ncbi:DoxX family protein [Natronospirillum operosum]|uniref:DoxX family protein n=1 Tax=Natronospirillum operosum TaxID=2759953 RepID=A0A4Z0W409_9GAMM|nr:DoxX family protein [Natronospirillum operosum]TGG89968.1 DoxX family protein [Natronospirillum operosum]
MNTDTNLQKWLILFFRISMGWVFLSAGLRQVPDSDWTAAGFMSRSDNFSAFFDLMSSPPFINLINVVVPWAHLLIGLAMILGIGMRVSAVGGGLLMFLYYIPRFEFPDVIVEYHLVYTAIIIYLAAVRAGQIYGIESWVLEKSPLNGLFQRNQWLREIVK